MASWRMSAVIIGLIACAVVGCVANECDTKMTAMRTFYTSDSECSGVIAVLDKQSACSDSDKTLLEKCLKKKTSEWNDIIANCGLDHVPEVPSESEAPAAAPGDDDVMVGLSDSLEAGRKLLSTDASSSCMMLLYTNGLKEFDNSGAFSSSVSLAVMALASAIVMVVM